MPTYHLYHPTPKPDNGGSMERLRRGRVLIGATQREGKRYAKHRAVEV